jgi:NAD(P) transhydrogenase
MTNEPGIVPEALSYDYDLLIIGSGPGGHRAAIQGAKLGKRVALAEKNLLVGGVCVHTGTIPSKTLREAAMHLTGYRERAIYGASYTVKDHITMADLLQRAHYVINHEQDVLCYQLRRNGVDIIPGKAVFLDPHTVRIGSENGGASRTVSADKIVIAVGTDTARDPKIAFDGEYIFTSDELLDLENLPMSITVIGAGVIGLEYATIFAAIGIRVTLVDARPRMLDFVDAEVIDTLAYQMRQNRVTFRLGEKVSAVERFEDRGHTRVKISLESGKEFATEKALVSVGRMGATAGLGLETTGIEPDSRGRLKVDEEFQTEVDNIYAVGDIIGFPSLASTSREQGRLAVCNAFGVPHESIPDLFPYGIYTIPEISVCGKTEEELTDAGVPYEIGKATYREISRGHIIGDEHGFLKLLFHMHTRELLGVHILGEGATELVHIGQAVMAAGGKIDHFVKTVFNYPTLAECYKTAAFNGINRLAQLPPSAEVDRESLPVT